MVDKWVKTILAIFLMVLAVLAWGHSQAGAENRWGFGTDLGFLADTVDDEVFTLGFQADYFLDQNFSLGPQVWISPGGDLTQVTVAGIARYHIPLGSVAIIPFGGVGFVYADLDQGRINNDDISYSFPFGTTAAFRINRTVSLASTLVMTFQDLDIDRRISSDNFNIGLLFGFRFQP